MLFNKANKKLLEVMEKDFEEWKETKDPALYEMLQYVINGRRVCRREREKDSVLRKTCA